MESSTRTGGAATPCWQPNHQLDLFCLPASLKIKHATYRCVRRNKCGWHTGRQEVGKIATYSLVIRLLHCLRLLLRCLGRTNCNHRHGLNLTLEHGKLSYLVCTSLRLPTSMRSDQRQNKSASKCPQCNRLPWLSRAFKGPDGIKLRSQQVGNKHQPFRRPRYSQAVELLPALAYRSPSLPADEGAKNKHPCERLLNNGLQEIMPGH